MPTGEGVTFYRKLSAMARKRHDSPAYYIGIPPEVRRFVQHGQLYQVVLILQGTTVPPLVHRSNGIGASD